MGLVAAGTELGRQDRGQIRDAPSLVSDAAELVLEHDVVQALDAGCQGMLPILVVEEGGVRQAGTNDLFVPLDDLGRIAAFDIAHGDKTRLQLTVAVDHRKVLLMALHRGHQRLGGNFEERAIEAACQGPGPFHQARDFVEEVRIHHRRGVHVGGAGFHLLPDALAALLEVCDHLRVEKRGFIVVGVVDSHRAGGMESMAAALLARGNAHDVAEA